MTGFVYGLAAAKTPTREYISAATAAGVGANLSINKPTDTYPSNLLLSMVGGENSKTWTGDTGWGELLEDAASGMSCRFANKIAIEADPSSWTFTANNGGRQVGCILNFRNARLQLYSDTVTRSATANLTVPGIGTDAGTVLLVLGHKNNSPRTITPPSGFTLLSGSASTSNDNYQAVYSKDFPAGATGDFAVTLSGAPSSGQYGYVVRIMDVA